MNWKQVRLGDVALKIRNGLSPSNQGKIPFNVLTLTAITGTCFNEHAFKAGTFNDIPKDKLVVADDFLVCRGNGNINLVGAGKCPTSDMPNTLFPDTIIGVRIDSNIIYNKYLEHVWCHSFVRSQINKKARTTNGTFKINQAALESILIPLPTLPEQKRIAAILDKADAIRKKRKKALELADQFLKSVFLDMFGDPVTNPRGWSVSQLGEIAEISRGRFSPRPRNDPQFYGGEYPFIQTGDIVRSDTYVTTHAQTLNEKGLKVSKMFPEGTIMMTIAANIGETAILKYPTCCPDSVVGIIPKNAAYTEFLEIQLRNFKEKLNRDATETAQKNINLENIRPLAVVVPSAEHINKFNLMYQEHGKSKSLLRRNLVQADDLLNSLSARAFNGEL